jgi:hypothetical protein
MHEVDFKVPPQKEALLGSRQESLLIASSRGGTYLESFQFCMKSDGRGEREVYLVVGVVV